MDGVAENSKAIVNGNPEVEFGYATDARSAAELRCALAVPLEGVNGLVGVLALYDTEVGARSPTTTSASCRSSRPESLTSWENALKYREAKTSATVDFLTGLANARALYLHLEQEVARSRQQDSTFAIMVCDLDGFKQINDRFGHLAGDRVLKIFANHLRTACRNYDYTARMGGDEFVIIAPNMPESSVSRASVEAQRHGATCRSRR